MKKIVFALAAAGLASVAPAQAQQAVTPTEQTITEAKKVKRMREAVATGSLARRYRSRGPQAKPAKRPNRATIGKRVRRKHRRAA